MGFLDVCIRHPVFVISLGRLASSLGKCYVRHGGCFVLDIVFLPDARPEKNHSRILEFTHSAELLALNTAGKVRVALDFLLATGQASLETELVDAEINTCRITSFCFAEQHLQWQVSSLAFQPW